MKYIPPLIGATIIIILAYWLGYAKQFGLAWYPNATIIGGLIGLVIALILIKLNRNKLNVAIILLLTIAASITYYYARVFIDSANFEPEAGYNWFLGYHVTMALLVPSLAIIINKIVDKFK